MKKKKCRKSKEGEIESVPIFLGDWTESKKDILKAGPDMVEVIKKQTSKKKKK